MWSNCQKKKMWPFIYKKLDGVKKHEKFIIKLTCCLSTQVRKQKHNMEEKCKGMIRKQTWLYFARRSPLQGAPALIWPEARPTDKSAIKESSVSPDLWDITTPQGTSFANLTTSMASVTVPIWFIWNETIKGIKICLVDVRQMLSLADRSLKACCKRCILSLSLNYISFFSIRNFLTNNIKKEI